VYFAERSSSDILQITRIRNSVFRKIRLPCTSESSPV